MDSQVYGVFTSAENAELAVSALRDHGVETSEISVVRRHDGVGLPMVEDGGEHGFTTTTVADAERGALKGGAIGLAIGILGSAAALTIPGFGIILAAGPLWAAVGASLAVTAAGALSGGIVGYLVDQGVPEPAALRYEAAIGRGDILVAVRSVHLSNGEARLLLEKYGATEIATHVVSGRAIAETSIATTYVNPDPLPAEPSSVTVVNTYGAAPVRAEEEWIRANDASEVAAEPVAAA